jgi:hypothetical protein
MERIHDILNSVNETLANSSQKTYKGQKRSELKDSDFLFPSTRSFPIVTPQDIPDAISNFGRMKGQMSYDSFLKKLYNFAKKKGPSFVAAFPEASKQKLNINKKTKAECEPDDSPEECQKEKLEDKLELEMLKKKLQQIKAEDGDFTKVEEMEEESTEMELMEYKYDFYTMSLGSIKSIAMHAQAILDAVESGSVKEGLTESWLQGKIAVTEDYMLTIHNFLMYGETETDTEGAEAAKNLPGLWENIRKKKEKMGKDYRPAKPGDKDRPDSEQWKKLTK